MKLWKIILIIAVVAVAIFFFRSREKTDFINYPPTATGDWVAFGDSLTSGFGASEGNDYPTVLGHRIGKTILNHGAPGNTTEDALRRVDAVARLKPRVVLLCFGGNDGLRQMSPEVTFANLAEIIDRLHANGSFVVLIGVRSASVSDRFAEPFEKLAEEKNVLFVPNILKGVLGSPNRMADYIHPNDEGYKAIAERLEKILNPLLPSL